MRIALLTPGGVDRCGTERVIPCLLWLIEHLVRGGDDVEVFAYRQEDTPGEWNLLGARVHNAAGSWRRSLWQLTERHRDRPFDVLYALWALPCGVVAGIAGKLLRVPVLLHLAGGDIVRLPEISYGGRLTLMSRIKTEIAGRGAQRILAPSACLVKHAHGLGIQCEQAAFGVALAHWPVLPPRPRNTTDPARLLHVGSLNKVKDHETLLRAAARLHRAGIAFTLDIIGEDTLHGAIQRFAWQFGLSTCVQFHSFLSHAELRPWFERADVLIVSSRFEAGPLVVLEAAVAGVPSVGTAVGHLSDWSPDAALAVPPGDDDGLARIIRQVVEDDGLRLRLAEAAQTRAIAENCEVTTGRIRAICAELSAGNRRYRPMRQAAHMRSK